jgi:hypothetical protein
MAARMQHFMPPGLLASQFEALEPLEQDEVGVVVPIEGGTQQIVQRALDALRPLTAGPVEPATTGPVEPPTARPGEPADPSVKP